MDSSETRWGPVGGGDDYQDSPPVPPPGLHRQHYSQDYTAPLMPPSTYGGRSNSASPVRNNRFDRHDSYNSGAYPAHSPMEFDDIDPHQIADDEDPFRDGTDSPQRRSNGVQPYMRAPVGEVGSGDGGMNVRPFGSRAHSGNYRHPSTKFDGREHTEKSSWKEMDEHKQRSRRKKILIIGGVLLLLAAIGAVVGGVMASKKSHSDSSSSSGTTSADSHSDNGLTANSKQVKALMNNPNLHKVFPAMDYTGVNMQYPACLTDAPSQDNVTLDVAMMSQLTAAIRTYGTDCNQTEMVLEAIDRLNMNDSLTVWLGVWLGNNETTNQRQLTQMYDVLQKYPTSRFKGVIVGNEVLFRKDLSLEQLGDTLQGVRQNLTSLKIDLPVATSDLGSDWTAQLVNYTDIVMANVHPFFAGVVVDQAASWTWSFWQNTDVVLTSGGSSSSTDGSKQIISEVGWPSQGGHNCGEEKCGTATGGSVAGIDEMNSFMDQWVCQAMANGTQYFWFEAFDEPWKIAYDSDGDGWEE